MIKYFVCPDGQLCEIVDCLKHCRMQSRCLSLPTLRAIAQQRVWTGKASTTQLIKGTREAYIDIMFDDLEISPDECMFRFLGTKVHLSLEELTGDMLAEEKVEDKDLTGIFDLYDHKEMCLYDYKTSGSYKIAKALGMNEIEVPVPGEVFKSGPRKGQEKTEKKIVQGDPDCRDWELQLNKYRLMLEDAGFPVESIKIEAIVRDGGTYLSKQRGITKNSYIIPIRRLPDDEVRAYFEEKNKALMEALEKKKMPPVCSIEERWGDTKCKGYCVACKHCDYGMSLKDGEVVNG
jgi:hypothetical protein